MAIVVTLARVQQWLEQTKLTLQSVDEEFAETARATAFASLVNSYDTTVWTNTTNTPTLVQSAISMLIAAWEYQRAYSEDGGAASYGAELEAKAYDLLNGIASGELALEEYPGVGAEAETVSFYPDDLTGSSDITDANGNIIGFGLDGAEDIRFRMGVKF